MANIQDLSSLFDSGNFGLLDRGLQAQSLDQEKRKADLATVLGQEQRNQAMHPWDVEAKQAVTGLNKSTTALNQYSLDTKLPVAQALDMNMQKFFKESDDLTRERTKANVIRYMQIASAAKKNGGQLPPGISVSPQEMQYFAPAHLDKLIQFGQTFLENDPTEIAARQRAREAQELAKLRTDGQIAVKTTPGAGGSKAPAGPRVPKSTRELLAHYTYLANQAEPDSPEQKQYLAMAEAEWNKIQMEAILRAQAPNAGKVDAAATANNPTGSVVARPPATPQPMPRAGGTWTPPNGWK